AFWIRLKEVVPSGRDPAQFPVEIGLAGGERCDRRGNRRVFTRPVEPGACQKPDRAPVQPGVHPITVELDLCSHSGPSGGASTSLVSCGLTQPASAVASAWSDRAIVQLNEKA